MYKQTCQKYDLNTVVKILLHLCSLIWLCEANTDYKNKKNNIISV